MPEFAYTYNTGSLKQLFPKIREVAVPQKVTLDWLVSLGFKSSNDRRMVKILKAINFVDASGRPTELWNQYRGKDYRQILAQGIICGYPELFNIYPDAFARNAEELGNVISTKSNGGKRTIEVIVSTFKTLCEMADFDVSFNPRENDSISNDDSASGSDPTLNNDETTNSPVIPEAISKNDVGGDVSLNINIQLTVSETTDSSVYDNFFAAMKKHLFS
ncbi:DUF5343 domain-containing protein [uncultured Methanofollis sp.]|uniref:DUF5343 domain-containing protein n=1 Tax=uncultured Methanofollis sp. TaxID=262500 RepID=UPI0026099D66|nr:DUF5343 domain-containing protein [uncultured Methanofollis sp.]